MAENGTICPDVPTFAEQGLKDFDVPAWYGFVAPVGTPAEAIQWLNTEVNAVLKDPSVIAKLDDIGALPVGGTPAQLAASSRRSRSDGARSSRTRTSSSIEQTPPRSAGDGTAPTSHFSSPFLESTPMKLLVLPGDGIGPEIVTEAVNVLMAADAKFGLGLSYDYEGIGFVSLEKHGTTLRENPGKEVNCPARIFDKE